MPPAEPPPAYRVLARSYRPTRLSELIGQDALVRTLTNALTSGRIAHAFLLAGIRGVGKTTTARIIARGLNCIGPDGQGGPTPEPCGVCPPCQAMSEDRALDVIEMDAATHTGIDDVREIVDSVRYAPTSSRFKVYIIDEVHMLSEKAFNGLLKTLEEPPPHVKFVFATTEIRKIPVTVLSRCQRFDLRRVEPAALQGHLESLCAKEGVAASPDALALIVGAAEGSVRDSLSLLEQAMALGDGRIEATQIQAMLGLGDRVRLLDLADALFAGDAARALDLFQELYALGADPTAILQDLLALIHRLSRAKAGSGTAGSAFPLTSELEAKAQAMADRLSLAVLARAWQMLLKGADETRHASDAVAAGEMVLLRLACASDLPPPAELARLLREGGAPPAPPRLQPAGPLPTSSPPARAVAAPARPTAAAPQSMGTLAPDAAPSRDRLPESYAALMELLRQSGEAVLAAWLEEGAHLIRYEVGRIDLRLEPSVSQDVVSRLQEAASRLTGRRWLIALGQAPGEPTLAEQERRRRGERLLELGRDAEVQRLLDTFPGATLVELRAPPRPSPRARKEETSS